MQKRHVLLQRKYSSEYIIVFIYRNSCDSHVVITVHTINEYIIINNTMSTNAHFDINI